MMKTMMINKISRRTRYRAKVPPKDLYGHYSKRNFFLVTGARSVWNVTAPEYRGSVKRVALAGGIGAGKTAVAERLTHLGFTVIDADVIARKVVQKGEPAWRALRDAFGTAVLDGEGQIDRPFLADIVFHDESALRRLNNVTHGYIGEEIVRELDATSASVVFVALPLYRPEHRADLQLDEVWGVLSDPAVALSRLVSLRGFSEADAQARLAAQMTNDDRLAIVDRVMWNNGTLEDLYGELDAALEELGVVRD
jgi:dephospho-CoA kinase